MVTWSSLTDKDIEQHSETLHKWLPVYRVGSFWLSEKTENDCLDIFINTFKPNKKDENEN